MDKTQARAKYSEASKSFREGRYEEALSALDVINQSFPNHRDTLFARAQCLALLGRVSEAALICDHLSSVLHDERGANLKIQLGQELFGDTATTASAAEEDTIDAPEIHHRGLRRVGHMLAGGGAAFFLLPKKVISSVKGAKAAGFLSRRTVAATAMIVLSIAGIVAYVATRVTPIGTVYVREPDADENRVRGWKLFGDAFPGMTLPNDKEVKLVLSAAGMKKQSDLSVVTRFAAGRLAGLDISAINALGSDSVRQIVESLPRLDGLLELRLSSEDMPSMVENGMLIPIAGLSKLRLLEAAGSAAISLDAAALIGTLTSLRALNLNGAGVTDDCVSYLAHLENLRELYLDRTSLTDAAMKTVASFENLRVFHADSTGMTNDGLALLAGRSPEPAVESAGVSDEVVQFCAAVEQGDIETARQLVKKNPDLILAKDAQGRTPLHLSVTSGRTEILRLLVEEGIASNKRKWRDAEQAAERDEPGASNRLWHMREESFGSGYGKERIGALCDNEGVTPLHLAARDGNVDAVGLLFEFGCDVHARSSTGTTPLHEAAVGGHEKVVDFLLSKGALPQALDNSGALAETLVPSGPTSPPAKRLHKARLMEELLDAVRARSLESIERILAEAPELAKERSRDSSPLLVACELAPHSKLDAAEQDKPTNIELARLFLDRGADLSLSIGCPPIHVAVDNEDFELATFLLGKGADINAPGYGQRNMIQWCGCNNQEISKAEFLLEHKANINSISPWGETALDMAIDNSRINKRTAEIETWLREHGAKTACEVGDPSRVFTFPNEEIGSIEYYTRYGQPDARREGSVALRGRMYVPKGVDVVLRCKNKDLTYLEGLRGLDVACLILDGIPMTLSDIPRIRSLKYVRQVDFREAEVTPQCLKHLREAFPNALFPSEGDE